MNQMRATIMSSQHVRHRPVLMIAAELSVLLMTCNGFSSSSSFGYRQTRFASQSLHDTTTMNFGASEDLRLSSIRPKTTTLSSATTTISPTLNDVIVAAKPSRVTHNDDIIISTKAAELLDDETVEAIAGRLEGMVSIPLVPGPLVNLAWTKVVELLTTDIDSSLMNEIQIMLDAEATNTKVDDVTIDDMKDLSKRIAADLNGHLDMPFLSEEQELDLLEQITEGMLRILTVRKTERRLKGINVSIDISKQLLESPETRHRLADKLNERINIPLLNEDVEGKLLLQSVEQASEVLASLLPPQVVAGLLQNQNPEGLEALKQHLVDRMTRLLHLPRMARPFQRALVDDMVELVMEDLFGSKGELFLMNWNEQRDFYEDRRALFRKQMMLGQQTFLEEQEHLQQQIESVSKRIDYLNEKLQTSER